MRYDSLFLLFFSLASILDMYYRIQFPEGEWVVSNLKWMKLGNGASISKKEESKKLLVGTKVLVYWNKKPDDGWYAGTILELSAKKLTVAKQAILHSPQELAKAAQVCVCSLFFFLFFFSFLFSVCVCFGDIIPSFPFSFSPTLFFFFFPSPNAGLKSGLTRPTSLKGSVVPWSPSCPRNQGSRVHQTSRCWQKSRNSGCLVSFTCLLCFALRLNPHCFSFLISRKEILEKTPQNQNTIVNGVYFTPLSRKFPDITDPAAVLSLPQTRKLWDTGSRSSSPTCLKKRNYSMGSIGCTPTSLQRSLVLFFLLFFSFFF